MKDNELAFTPAWKLAELIRNKELSPVEIVDTLLKRISELNPKLNAYLTVDEVGARAQARVAEEAVTKGAELPPLHGIPISIKDLNPTKGIRTTYGSLVFKDFVPDEDDIVVDRLRRSGVIILGKTNTPEFGILGTTVNRLVDDCRNPWDVERITGGSSGGAVAAVAAGLGPLAQGGDAGGSIRSPAGFCGVYGLKPTQGMVPQSLYKRNSINPFGVTGTISRTVRDAALMLDAMAGYDHRDPTSIKDKPPCFLDTLKDGIKGLKVAWTPGLGLTKVDTEVRSAVKVAAYVFKSLGCHIEEAAPKDAEKPLIKYTMQMAHNYAWHSHLLAEHEDKLTSYVRVQLAWGKAIKGFEYFNALASLAYYRRNMAEFFENYDLLLLPTNTCPAFKIGQRPSKIPDYLVRQIPPDINIQDLYFDDTDDALVLPFNMTGQPAATIPCGFSSEGLPLGLQIVGRWGDEATVLRASAAFEEAQPWANRIPPLTK